MTRGISLGGGGGRDFVLQTDNQTQDVRIYHLNYMYLTKLMKTTLRHMPSQNAISAKEF